MNTFIQVITLCAVLLTAIIVLGFQAKTELRMWKQQMILAKHNTQW